jgi:hypothetical protein
VFFLKKEPNDLYLFGSAQGEASVRPVMTAQAQKFFASFFQKRSASFFLPAPVCPAPIFVDVLLGRPI